MISCAAYRAWPSPSLPYLKSEKSEFHVTDVEGSWIVSLYSIGDLVGCLLSPCLVDKIGRKYTLLVYAIPNLIGCLLITIANNVSYLYIARFIGGIGHGGIFNLIVIYVSEISEKNIRGILMNIMNIASNLGSCIFTAIGAYFSYQILNITSITIPIIFLITFVFMPETPYFYLMNNKNNDAVSSIMKLRGVRNQKSIEYDLMSIKSSIICYKNQKNPLRELLTNKNHQKGLFILLCLKAAQFLAGKLTILAYTQEIFSYTGSSLAPEHCVMILGGIDLISGFIVGGVIERYSRKILLLTSGLLTSICLFVCGLFFFVKNQLNLDVSNISWIPLLGLIVYMFAYSLGIGTIPYMVLGEIFPVNVKGTAISIGLTMGSIFSFLVTFTYSYINDFAGIHTNFWIYAICSLIGAFVNFKLTPETRGKTLEEIQTMLKT